MSRPIALLLALFLLSPSAAEAKHGLPLGSPWLRETRTTDVLAPGVAYTKIVRGNLSARDGWTVDAAVVADRTSAVELVRRLRSAGFAAEVLTLQRPPDDRRPGPLGYRVSALSARHGALAGVNGGYFVIGDADGTPGDLAGSSIIDGEPVSEAVDGRTDLVLGSRGPFVSAITDREWVTASDGATRELDGENRKPGLIRACGGTGGDLPTERPLHDVTCTDPSELIRSTSVFGSPTDAGPGAEELLDGTGSVTAVRTTSR